MPESSTRNPLLWPLIGINVAALQDLWELFRVGRIDALGIWSIGAATVLLVLYRRRSRAAGAFMFYSLLPIYPMYVLLTATGLYAQPSTPAVYGVLAAVWAVLSYFVWRWKKQYETYVAAAPNNVSTAQT